MQSAQLTFSITNLTQKNQNIHTKHYFTAPDKVNIISTECLLRCSVVSDSMRPHGLEPARLPSFHGILQARTLECVAISLSRLVWRVSCKFNKAESGFALWRIYKP